MHGGKKFNNSNLIQHHKIRKRVEKIIATSQITFTPTENQENCTIAAAMKVEVKRKKQRMMGPHRTRKAQSSLVFILALITIAIFTRWFDLTMIARSLHKRFNFQESLQIYSNEFDCSLSCSEISPVKSYASNPSRGACPEYFRWIHEDLRPWKDKGITREIVEKAKDLAHIRITIVNGRLYVEKYKNVFHTRDVITIWGLLQLLRLYPGRIPDLDLMFECDDRPVIRKRDFGGSRNASVPPPMFHYCGDESSYDIVFPDWTFWGPEVNIKPWNELKEELKEGNKRIKWTDREPYAYWKGNIRLSSERRNLAKCNSSDDQGSKARIFGMDWIAEKKQGYKNSDLASQCTYRYKIYVEGVSWSVSQKYILACDSMALIIKPRYYDFFTRSLLPTIHYWPISGSDSCESVKLAVEWGNKYTDKAQEIGKVGSNFIHENLVMDNIYDYTFHLLNEYAKLLKYKPTIPEGAVETCSEALVCSVKGQKRRYRKHSMVKNPADSSPCTLPPPYERAALRAFVKRKENLENEVLLQEKSGKSSI